MHHRERLELPSWVHGLSSLDQFRMVVRLTDLFVLGDNLMQSADSRGFEPIGPVFGSVERR